MCLVQRLEQEIEENPASIPFQEVKTPPLCSKQVRACVYHNLYIT
jgi:hypothetical protein